MIGFTGALSPVSVQVAQGAAVFDLDEAFHCLQTLDVRGRKALRLCDLMWQEIHDAAGGHPPNPLTRRYLAELSERTEEVRVLRERLDDALDGREAAESMLAKTRALATHWGAGGAVSGAGGDSGDANPPGLGRVRCRAPNAWPRRASLPASTRRPRVRQAHHQGVHEARGPLRCAPRARPGSDG